MARKLKKISNATLDKLWSEEVKKEANYACEYCGKKDGLNSHHIFGRRSFNVRWDVSNGCLLCVLHHTFGNDFSAHQTPTRFTEWIIGERGEKWYKDLNDKARAIWDKDREKILKELKK